MTCQKLPVFGKKAGRVEASVCLLPLVRVCGYHPGQGLYNMWDSGESRTVPT